MVCDDRFSHVKPDRHRAFREKPKTVTKMTLREKKRPKKRFDSTLGYPGEGPARARMPTCALCALGVTCTREQHGHTSRKPKLGAARRIAEKKPEPSNPRYYPCHSGLGCENLDCHYHITARHNLVEARLIDDDGIEAKSMPQGPGAVQVIAGELASPISVKPPRIAAAESALQAGGIPIGDLKQMIGEHLFLLIQARQPMRAAKITGMLLELEPSELFHLLEGREALDKKIVEAIEVLGENKSVIRPSAKPLRAKRTPVDDSSDFHVADKKGGFNDIVVPASAEIKDPLPPTLVVATSPATSTSALAPPLVPKVSFEGKWGDEVDPPTPDPVDDWEPAPNPGALCPAPVDDSEDYQLVEVPLCDDGPKATPLPVALAPVRPLESRTHRRAIFVQSTGQEYEVQGRSLSLARTKFWLRTLFKEKRRMFCRELSNQCERQYKVASNVVVDGFFANTLAWFTGKEASPILDPHGSEQLRLNFFEGVFDLVYIGKVYTKVTDSIMLDPEFCGKRVIGRDGVMNANLASYIGSFIARDFNWALNDSEIYANTVNFCVNRLFLREKDSAMATRGQPIRDPLNGSCPSSKVYLNGGGRKRKV
jgi:hypothetical protein